MVSVGDNITLQKVLSRDKKQAAAGDSLDKKDIPASGAATVSLDGGTPKAKQVDQSTILKIAAANKEAAGFTLEDKDAADKILQQTISLMRENPNTAKLSQSNISSQIVLDILYTK